MLSGEIDALHDDGFEGSNDELCISREVFYGSYSAGSCKKSAVSGVVNAKFRQSKLVEAFHCPKSEKFSLKSQAYSKNLCLKDAGTAMAVPERKFSSEDTDDVFAFVDMDDETVTAKRMKLSADQLSGLKPHLEDALPSSMQLKDFFCGAQQPISPPFGPFTMFHVVESSAQGVMSSHYTLKQDVDSDKERDFGSRDVTKGNFSGSDKSKGNTNGVPVAIASPDSQESFATKALAAGPSVTVANEFRSLLSAGKKPKKALGTGPSVEFENDILLRGNGAKDPRLILRHRTFCLLREAGWSIERRKRNCRSYFEFVYRTPEGRPVREFPKAWDLCGKRLLVHGASQLLAEEEKQWNDINEFWSDLFETLRTVDNQMKDWEPKAALALKWALLDPFATVVFIDRKILALKTGNVVKAKSSMAAKGRKSTEISPLKSLENEDDGACEKPIPTVYYDSSLPSESSIFDFDGQSPGVAVQLPVSRSVYVSEGNSMTLVETLNGSGSCNEETFTAETRHRSTTESPSCVSDVTCLQPAGCLYDVPIEIVNFDIIDRHSETFSSHRVSCAMSSLSCSKQNLEPSMDIAENAGLHLFVEGAKPLERRLNDGGMRQTSSEDDNPICTNGELIKSSRLNKACVHSSNNVDIGFPSWKESQIGNLQCIQKESVELAMAVDEGKLLSPEASISDVDQIFGEVVVKCIQCSESQNLEKNATYCSGNFDSKKKLHKKSKKISEIERTTSHASKSSIRFVSFGTEADIEETNYQISHVKLSEMEEGSGVQAQLGESCYKVSNSNSQYKSGKKKSRYRNFDHDGTLESDCSKEVKFGKIRVETAIGSCSNKKSRKSCQLKDDDLLISAIIQKKIFRSSGCGPKASKLKAPKRGTSQKGPCRLLPRSLGKGGKHMTDVRWSLLGERTVLFWLINRGAILLNEVIQFRDSKGDNVVKDGFITRDGILCKCCSGLLSVSQFKVHAGFVPSQPCLNLFMESGKPFTLCQLQAWSTEYKARKSGTQTVLVDESDQNDDSCGWCGDGGELLCCDNCPSTFHQSCLLTEELPEGSWYCPDCSCRSCGNLVDEKEASSSYAALKCSQCEHKYHGACLEGKGLTRIKSNLWFCTGGCEEVYSGLHSRIGISNHIAEGFFWTLLRCIRDDQKIHSALWFALKAECNSKLAVALTIMEECFVSMVDPRTGINMIPHAVFNRGSAFSRLNYHGFYTAVLEKDDVLISVASIRVHGTKVAEMPLIATCSKYRRQGMCRQLLSSIEEMLISFRVEKLVIAAIPSLVETWTVGFGFIIMEEDEKRSLNKTNLMVFPGTVMLKKTLYANQGADLQNDVRRREESAKKEADGTEEYVHEERGTCRDEEEVGVVEAESNMICCVVGSPANREEDDAIAGGAIIPGLKNDVVVFRCSNMEVDFHKESDGPEPPSMNLQPEDTRAIESSGDIQALQINGYECNEQYSGINVVDDKATYEVDSVAEIGVDSVVKSRAIESGDIQALQINNGYECNVHSGINVVTNPETQSHKDLGENGLLNPPLSEEAGSRLHHMILDSKTSEKDEEQEILEAFAAVKAAFNNQIGGGNTEAGQERMGNISSKAKGGGHGFNFKALEMTQQEEKKMEPKTEVDGTDRKSPRVRMQDRSSLLCSDESPHEGVPDVMIL